MSGPFGFKNGNGRGPMPMPSAAGVPIVGQAISISDYKIILMITCGCGAQLLFAGKIGQGVACAKCRRTAQLDRFDSNGPRVNWGMRIGRLDAPAEEPIPEDAPLG